MFTLQGLQRLWLFLSNFIILPCLIGIATWYVLLPEVELECIDDFANKGDLVCKPKCQKGYFSLPDMENCRRWLGCKEISKIKEKWILGQGIVKNAHLGSWRNHSVVLNKLRFEDYRSDFNHGLKMLKKLSPSPFIVQFLGSCSDVYVTEFHRHGSLSNLEDLFISNEIFRKYDTRKYRFRTAIRYVEILDYLHNSPIGTRVMCDSNDIKKTVSQYLITDDLRMVVNDLDALPLVNHTKNLLIKCGNRELFGDFVAPEQKWPFDKNDKFDNDKMPGYDEKTDIWKIPDVFKHLISDTKGADSLKYYLFDIHKKCKSKDPKKRPSTKEILKQYYKVWKKYYDS
ncbi:unnamed protein product [Owenia fusiformis]|uniref:Protein O-mannose kinase n=1 Tax=Owenia fusiformis TaxID=6347 RepID=A0A8J1XFF0_OWEFU|nr:unnamed protein product [Owenia fusiformis]